MISFSVLMPVYVKENPSFLASALASILVDQTIKPAELVIVEDGPLTKELTQVIEKYCVQFPKIILVLKLERNMGMGYAMNYGLNHCSHEWIFRMDSDDIAIPSRFEKQVKFIEFGKFDVIGSAIEEFNNKVGDLKQFRIMPENQKDIINMMKKRNPMNHMTVAFKKNIAINAGGYWDKRYFEDYNLWYEMYKLGARFYNIQKPLVNVRIGNNMIARRSGNDYYQYEKILMLKFLSDQYVTLIEYRIILGVKYILRNMPISFLRIFYKIFLRKRL